MWFVAATAVSSKFTLEISEVRQGINFNVAHTIISNEMLKAR